MAASLVKSALLIAPATDPVAALNVNPVPLLLVTGTVVLVRVPSARFAAPPPAAFNVVPVKLRLVPSVISSIAPVAAVERPSNLAVLIVMPVPVTAPLAAASVMP